MLNSSIFFYQRSQDQSWEGGGGDYFKGLLQASLAF